MSLIWFILIGTAAGWLAGKFTKGSGFGLVGNMIVGVVGSLVGGVLFWLLGLAATGLLGKLIVATVGAVAALTAFQMISKR